MIDVVLTDGLSPTALDFDPEVLDAPLPKARIRDRKKEWQNRKERVKRKAHEIRDSMRFDLGNACKYCGATLDDFDRKGKPVVLCFDHGEHVRDWEPRKMNLLQRMKRYQLDHKRGLIVLSCNECNGYDGAVHGKERARRNRKAMEKR